MVSQVRIKVYLDRRRSREPVLDVSTIPRVSRRHSYALLVALLPRMCCTVRFASAGDGEGICKRYIPPRDGIGGIADALSGKCSNGCGSVSVRGVDGRRGAGVRHAEFDSSDISFRACRSTAEAIWCHKEVTEGGGVLGRADPVMADSRGGTTDEEAFIRVLWLC